MKTARDIAQHVNSGGSAVEVVQDALKRIQADTSNAFRETFDQSALAEAADIDRRIAGGAAVGAHRTSMLQDLDQGRPMEIDALVASVQELGRVTGVPTPTIDTVLGLIRLRARTAGLYS